MNRRFFIAFVLVLWCGLPSASAQPALGYAQEKFNHHDYQEAATALEDIASRPSAGADVYDLLIWSYLYLKQPEQALAACERGMRALPGNATIETHYVALLRSTLARKELQTRVFDALAAHPQSPVFQKTAARLLYEADPRYERAGALLAMASRSSPGDPEVHFFFGQWLCLNQREPACVQELTTAAETTEVHNQDALAQIWALIATAESNMGHAEEAARAWEKFGRANEAQERPSPELMVQYVMWLRNTGHLDDAAASVRRILHRYPTFGPAHFEAAQVAFSRNDPDTATREARVALDYRGFSREQRKNIHAFSGHRVCQRGAICGSGSREKPKHGIVRAARTKPAPPQSLLLLPFLLSLRLQTNEHIGRSCRSDHECRSVRLKPGCGGAYRPASHRQAK